MKDYTNMIEEIKLHLSEGGRVMIATYTKATLYDKRHIEMFKVGADGSPLVQHGKRWDDIRFSTIRLYKGNE